MRLVKLKVDAPCRLHTRVILVSNLAEIAIVTKYSPATLVNTPQLFTRVNGRILVLAYDHVYQVQGLIILLADLPSLQGLYNRLKQRKQARDCTVPNRLPLSEIFIYLASIDRSDMLGVAVACTCNLT